jgi:hypothetical protein
MPHGIDTISKKRVRCCGATCHNAKGSKCRCWCGGIFHGHGNEATRAAFKAAVGVDKLPTTEAKFKELTGQPSLFGDGLSAADDWRTRHDAAKTERGDK